VGAAFQPRRSLFVSLPIAAEKPLPLHVFTFFKLNCNPPRSLSDHLSSKTLELQIAMLNFYYNGLIARSIN
jgi:hypothetical protein